MADPRLDYEAGQTAVAMTALTDSGDNKTFNSAAELWSNRAGFTPAGTAWIAGVEVDISAATDETITRADNTESDTHKISSVTITALGDIAIVAGADHISFDTDRGEDGGPPWIDNAAIEIAQVKLTDDDDNAAPITAAEIVQVPGSSRETALFPVWEQERIRVSNGAFGYAGITFASALDACHSENAGTTTAAKEVYASYYTPSFSQVPKASDFVRPANSYSVSSTEYYGGAMGSRSTSIQQGSFTGYTESLTEGFLVFEGEELWFKFRNDRLVTLPAVYCQGVLGIAETFNTDGSIEVAATISAQSQGERILA